MPIVVVGSLAAMIWAASKAKEKLAFLASGLYLTGMLGGAAFALYPTGLPARVGAYSLTIRNTAAGHHGLWVGLVGWIFGLTLALACFFFIYRRFKGKVQVEGEGY